MNPFLRVLIAVLLALPLLSASTSAHFKLVEPASWINEDERGDPQKLGPCGGDPAGKNEELLTGAVTKVTGGTKLHVSILETIYHSGHYRIALAVNSRNEIPADPVAAEVYTDRGLYSVWGTIQSPPQLPVLADGLFPHYPAPGEPDSARLDAPLEWETDIEIPNINCENCTLQVLQFMAGHVYNQPGGYSYHHCADLAITADPAKPIDTRWPGQGAD